LERRRKKEKDIKDRFFQCYHSKFQAPQKFELEIDKPALRYYNQIFIPSINPYLSGEFSVRQAQREVIKIKNLDLSYWA
jgi:hypothetical protein